MSIWIGIAWPPSSQIAVATRAADSSERSATATAAPVLDNVLAIASPMPLPPPVTSATSPDRSMAMLIGSVRPAVSGEIRLALFREGGGALFGLVGLKEDVEPVLGEQREAALVVGVGIEGVFEEAQRGRAVARDGAAPLDRGRQELVRGHDPVDEPPALCVGGRVLIEQEPDLSRPLLPHDASEVGGTEATVERTDARTGLPEPRVLGRDREVAKHVQDVAAADGEAVHGRDHGLGDVADEAVGIGRLEQAVRCRAVVTRLRSLLDVAAHAEGAVACTGQDDCVRVVVRPRALERVDKFLDGPGTEGVEPAGPVYGDDRHRAVDVVEDVLVISHQSARSSKVPVPSPPPQHIVTRAWRPLVRFSSWTALVMSTAPVAPSGWPSAIAPPLGLTRVMSASTTSAHESTTEANASLISTTSMSLMANRLRRNIWGVTSCGPVSIITGSTPMRVESTTLAKGLRLCSAAHLSLVSRTAAAPSEICELVPAVWTPSGSTVFSCESFSRLVSRRPSSLVTVEAPVSMGTI